LGGFVVVVVGPGGPGVGKKLVVVLGTDVVVAGLAVDVVVAESGLLSVGACSLNGTAAWTPPTTYTGVPLGTTPGNQLAAHMGMRTQPCEAG
jgi:hypothetical protein